MSLRSLLCHTADVETLNDNAKSAAGFVKPSWIRKASAVRCRFDPVSEKAAIEYGRLGLKVSHTVHLDADYALSVRDRFVFQGGHYEVKSVTPAYRTEQTPALWTVQVERRATGAT